MSLSRFAWLLMALAAIPAGRVFGEAGPGILWRQTVSPRNVVVRGSLVVADGRLVALDSSTGQEKWTAPLPNKENRMSRPPILILDDVVATSVGRALFLFDRKTGALRSQTEFEGGIQRLVGPPLLVQYGLSAGSAIDRADPATGESRSRVELGFVEGIWIESGTLVVQSSRKSVEEANELSVMTGLDLDLKAKWSLRADFLDFELVDGTPVVSQLSHEDRGASFHPIDLATGALGPALPPRGTYESEWGGGTWEFEVPVVRDDGETIRRNDIRTGGAKWVVDLPFGGHILVRSGDRIFWCGGAETSSLAEIAWETGKVRRICKGYPELNELFESPRGLVGWAFDGSLIGIPDPCDLRRPGAEQ